MPAVLSTARIPKKSGPALRSDLPPVNHVPMISYVTDSLPEHTIGFSQFILPKIDFTGDELFPDFEDQRLYIGGDSVPDVYPPIIPVSSTTASSETLGYDSTTSKIRKGTR